MCGSEVPGGSGCDDVNGKTTAEMQSTATFLEAGWDFVDEVENGPNDVWKISEGLDYPRLSWQKYSGGTGEPNDPYRIATAEDLILLGETPEDYDKNFVMTDDIDLDPNLPGRKVFDRAVIAPDTDPTLNRHGNQVYDGRAFTGVFDGNSHIISHLTIAGESYLGLFGYVGSEAKISNLGLEATDVNGKGKHIGSIAGSNFQGIITASYNTGKVRGSECIGGLMGSNDFGSITTSSSTGTVSGDNHIGGLVGYNWGKIEMSYSTGTVIGYKWIGGLVGWNANNINKSYSTAVVTGDWNVGGLVGGNYYENQEEEDFDTFPDQTGIIDDCYSTGSVTGNICVGGLVGDNRGVISTSFWDMDTSSMITSDGGIGKTTAEMQMESTFIEAGWDFVDETENGTEDIWWIDEGQDYPRLWWEQVSELEN
jgi:hypothetical protein